MKKIRELAKLFAEYKIYPKVRYNDRSVARVFQRMFPENHYSKDFKTFLSYQDYKPTQRGADLSWWGKKFFSEELGFRTMIISQDSKVEDAGSVVLLVHIFQVIENFDQYKEFVKALGEKGSYGFKNRMRVKEQLSKWNIDLDFLYITDASKVYKKGSRKDFDKQKSKQLLEREIEFCNPNLLILLGQEPLSLLDKTRSFAKTVEGGKPIRIKRANCVVSPFITGLGIIRKDFGHRLEIASSLIKKYNKR